MNLQDLVSSLRVENATDLEARAKATSKLAELRGAEVKGEEVSAEKVEKLRSKKADIDTRVELRNARIAQLEADIRSDEAATKMSNELRATGAVKPAYDNVARVGREERTYHPGNDPKGKRFITDVARYATGGFGAAEALQRHMSEEMVERSGTAWAERATSTGSFVGLTVPQYLTDFYAPNAKAMRPFIQACRQMDLPSQGMVVNISRITTGASADVQAPQNNAVSNQDLQDTLLTIPVQTLAAQQVMSRQAIERSTGAEEVTLDDLMRTMYSKQDNLILNQAVTGLTNRANPLTFTASAGTATAQALYAQMLNARQSLESVLLDVQEGDQLAVMHSRRWASINSISGTNFPFLSQAPNSRYLTAGEDDANNYGPGYRGNFAGLNVIVDNNVATNLGAGSNQDEIYVVNRREAIIWEDPTAPVMIRAEQTNAASLGVLFVMYSYWAYTFDRYQVGGFSAQQKVSGTGLTTPGWLGTFVN